MLLLVRTSLRMTLVVIAGDFVPAGTTLVTPGLRDTTSFFLKFLSYIILQAILVFGSTGNKNVYSKPTVFCCCSKKNVSLLFQTENN